MHANARLVTDFYAAFGRRDAEGMIACYGADLVFQDPVFGVLDAEEAAEMWRMLCAQGEDLRVEASGIHADDASGRARWVATYTWRNGRVVVNTIDARFRFAEGRIVEHRDAFDLWRWTQMALGVPGYLLGWAPPFQARIRSEARAGLAAWRRRAGAGTAAS